MPPGGIMTCERTPFELHGRVCDCTRDRDAASAAQATTLSTAQPATTTSADSTETTGQSSESGSGASRRSRSGSGSKGARRTARGTKCPVCGAGVEGGVAADGWVKCVCGTRFDTVGSYPTPPEAGPPGADVEAQADELLGDKKKLYGLLRRELLIAYLLEVEAGKDRAANPQHSRASRKQAKELAELLARLTNEEAK